MNSRQITFPQLVCAQIVLGSIVAICGCTGPSRYDGLTASSSDAEADFAATDMGEIQQASNSRALPVTFTDRRSLQYDTGQMDPDFSPEFQATHSGLRYRVLRKSDGRKPTASDTVTVHYRGWLDDGKEFDSSYDRGKPATFPLNGVVAGWTEGMQLIGEGGMIELWVPGRLGYGTQGSGNIPPNATLHFVVELVRVN